MRSHPQHVWVFQGPEFFCPPRDHALNLEEIRVNKSTDELINTKRFSKDEDFKKTNSYLDLRP